MKRKTLIPTLIVVAGAAALLVSYAVGQDAPPPAPGRTEPAVAPGRADPREAPRRRARETRPRRYFSQDRMERMTGYIGLVGQMKRVCFDPSVAGMMAVGNIKDGVKRKPDKVIADLEALLTKTKSLGIRNAIRLSLQDLYREQGLNDKLLQNCRDMVAENDAAIQKMESRVLRIQR